MFLSIFSKSQNLSERELNNLIDSLQVMINEDQNHRSQAMYGTTDSNKLREMRSWNTNKQVPYLKLVVQNKIGISKEMKDSLRELQEKYDSINLERLLRIINDYGFPNSKLLKNRKVTNFLGRKMKAENVVPLMLVHFVSEREYNRLLPIFNSELAKGKLSQQNFSIWYDRCQYFMQKTSERNQKSNL